LIDGSLTLFSSSSYVGGSQPAASGELHPRPAVALRGLRHARPPRHPLILDGFRLRALRRFVGLCLHVLSSFQRTGIPARPRLASISPSGEPYESISNVTALSIPLCGTSRFLRSCFPEGISHLEDNPKGD
jgi:hypothetical protein